MDSIKRNLPVLCAIGIILAVSIWMVSGLGNEPPDDPIAAETEARSSALQQVRVMAIQAQDFTSRVLISGHTQANRQVEVKAETDGNVTAILAERGEPVAQGAPILSLDIRDRQARLAEANALLAQRELQFNATENLRSQQFTTDVQIAEARAQLESARALKEQMELAISHTTIVAPFDGLLQDRSVEIGDYVQSGDTVAEVVDLDPLVVAGDVNEREVSELAEGSEGIAVLSDGRELAGRIRYIAPRADPNTRSFLVELAVPNPGGTVRAGLTAQLRLFSDTIRVHTVSAALLSLADDGTVGVKIVDSEDVVRFHPVEIAGTTTDGMHVTGLPDAIRLITVGQGYVTDGQKVEPVVISDFESAAEYERAD